MKMSHLLKRVSVATAVIPVVICSVLIQDAKADMYRPLAAGGEDWVRITLDEGRHAILANSPGSLGDVDISLHDSSGTYIMGANKFGTDRLDFTVHQGGTFYIKYKMPSCANFFGPCNVSIDIF
jgi:hypothetical protein